MTTRFRAALAVFLWGTLSAPAHADVTVVKEVVIGPKSAVAAANIGSVNGSPNVRLETARVDIQVGEPTPAGPGIARAPIPLNVKAVFELHNQSDDELALTVGFPVSNSEFSAFEFEWFRVMADDEPRDVFRRRTAYPRKLVHDYVSGPSGPGAAAPPADTSRDSMSLAGGQRIGDDVFQNLMVWEERFSPRQKKRVEVQYEIEIPLQRNASIRRRVAGSHKGIWPQEANNVPASFLDRVPGGDFYFFDYYLTSGSSWAGPIGAEDVNVHLEPAWQGHELHTSAKGKFVMSGGAHAGPAAPLGYHYLLRDEEPVENLYFALRPRREAKSD